MNGVVAKTDRLLLRRWRPVSTEESDLFVQGIEADFEQQGFGLCAAELVEDHSFIGYIGLAVPKFSPPFTPCVEIGWMTRDEADDFDHPKIPEGDPLRRHVLYRLRKSHR